MISFKDIFKNDTAAIGLASLGLAKKIENNPVCEPQNQVLKKTFVNLSTDINQPRTINTLQLSFNEKKSTDKLDSLFSKNTSFVYKDGKIIG